MALRIVLNAEANGPDSRYTRYDYHPILIEVIFRCEIRWQEGMSTQYMNDKCQSFMATRRSSKEAFADLENLNPHLAEWQEPTSVCFYFLNLHSL
jgi:hypothetical protein